MKKSGNFAKSGQGNPGEVREFYLPKSLVTLTINVCMNPCIGASTYIPTFEMENVNVKNQLIREVIW